MTKTIEGAAGDLAADLAALREDVARLAEAMSVLVQHQTHAAGIHVAEAIGEARDKIVGTATDAQKHAYAANAEIEASVARHPLTTVLIAFGIGMSFGFLSRRRD